MLGLRVFVGQEGFSDPCVVIQYNHTTIECKVPAGIGKIQPVKVIERGFKNHDVSAPQQDTTRGNSPVV